MNATTRVTGNNSTVTRAMRPGRRSAIAFAEARSPLGFRGGLSNLTDYVGDDPTNATDPSGLETKPDLDDKFKYVTGLALRARFMAGMQIEAVPSNDVTSWDIKIQVYKDVEFDDRPNWIQLQYKKNPRLEDDFHFLQFAYETRKDHQGKLVPGVILTADQRYTPVATKADYAGGDARKLDTRNDEIFADLSSPNAAPGIKGNRGRSLYDKPDVDVISLKKDGKPEDYSELRSYFDTFIVRDDGTVYYHIHWERVGKYDPKKEKWTREYENIKGDVVKNGKLPPGYLNEKGELFLGYAKYDAAMGKYSEPIYKPFPPPKKE